MHHAYVHTDTQTHIRRHVYADTQTCIMYTSIRTKTRRHEGSDGFSLTSYTPPGVVKVVVVVVAAVVVVAGGSSSRSKWQ